MPGDYPAIHQGCWILLGDSGAGFVGSPSILALSYQLKWSVYWSHGHSTSRPTLSKVADFLWWLRSVRGLSVSSIKGYRSMLSVVFHFQLPAL